MLLTCCMLNSAKVAEYNGYCGIGIKTPGFFPSTSATNSRKID